MPIEGFLQTISVTTEVVISCRAHRFKLALRGRQEVREREREEKRAGGASPMAWRWSLNAE